MSEINFKEVAARAKQMYEYIDGNIHLGYKADTGEEVKLSCKIRNRISVDEMVRFVDSVASALFVNGEYTPALKPIVEIKAILAYYTDINADEIDNDTLAYLSGLRSFSRMNGWFADNEQIESLLDAVDERIRFTLDCALSEQKRRLDDAIDSMNTEQTNISVQMDNMIKIFKKIAKSAEGLDKEQIQKDLHAIAGMDERKIADAVIKTKK